MSYTPPVPRVIAGSDIGNWQETCLNTIYRNNLGWLICRARGKGSGGRITGKRFYVIARDGLNRPHKIRSTNGTVRFFDDPWRAATYATKYAISNANKWKASKAAADLHALSVEAKLLRLEIEHSRNTAAELRAYCNKLIEHRDKLEQDVRTLSSTIKAKQKDTLSVSESEAFEREKKAIPSHLFGLVTNVFKQPYKH